MWRLLVQAGLGFATFDISRRIARLKRTAMYSGVAALIALLALGALTAAAIIALAPHLGPAGAAAAIGVGLLAIAGIVAWAGTWERKPPPATPMVERVRAEIGAAGSAIAGSGGGGRMRLPGTPRSRSLGLVLIAAFAGIVLGRRL
jgi:uncharacterized membrane protein YqjE